VIILNQTVTWFSNDFLLLKVPALARLVDKNPEQTTLNIKQSYFQAKSQQLPR
jgi:hypothetical protein